MAKSKKNATNSNGTEVIVEKPEESGAEVESLFSEANVNEMTR